MPWHLLPRSSAPADPRPDATVWVRPAAELECGVEDARRDRLVVALRAALVAAGA